MSWFVFPYRLVAKHTLNFELKVVDHVFQLCFLLEYFDEYLKCYASMCAIAEYQKEWLEKEIERWNEDVEAHERNLGEATKKPWRPYPCWSSPSGRK